MRGHSRCNVIRQLLGPGNLHMQVDRILCNDDLLLHVGDVCNIPAWGVGTTREKVYGSSVSCGQRQCLWQTRIGVALVNYLGGCSASWRLARYQSTVRCNPSRNDICARQPSTCSARVGSMRRRG